MERYFNFRKTKYHFNRRSQSPKRDDSPGIKNVSILQNGFSGRKIAEDNRGQSSDTFEIQAYSDIPKQASSYIKNYNDQQSESFELPKCKRKTNDSMNKSRNLINHHRHSSVTPIRDIITRNTLSSSFQQPCQSFRTSQSISVGLNKHLKSNYQYNDIMYHINVQSAALGKIEFEPSIMDPIAS